MPSSLSLLKLARVYPIFKTCNAWWDLEGHPSSFSADTYLELHKRDYKMQGINACSRIEIFRNLESLRKSLVDGRCLSILTFKNIFILAAAAAKSALEEEGSSARRMRGSGKYVFDSIELLFALYSKASNRSCI